MPNPFNASSIISKEWQETVTVDLRNDLSQKLVQEMFPTPSETPYNMSANKLLVYYNPLLGKKVEGDVCEHTNSRSEYYNSLAEKICKIQKELEQKREKRKGQRTGKII